MFDIEYYGGNSIGISTKKLKLVADPRRSVVGLDDVSVKDAVVLATEERFFVNRSGERLAINSPGEYEVGDFSIRGIAGQRHIDGDESMQSVIYRVEVGDISIALLGNIAPSLTESQLESIGVVDILIIPVGGGGYTLDATSASSLTRSIDPKLVVPVHYADDGLKYEVPQDDLATFISELGAPVEQLPKYKLKSAAGLPQVLIVAHLDRV